MTKPSKQNIVIALFGVFNKEIEIYYKGFIKDFKEYLEVNINKLNSEFFSLCLFSIIDSCNYRFKDEQTRNEILDLFHKMVYKKMIQTEIYYKGEISYRDWIALMGKKYSEYFEAVEKFKKSKEDPSFTLSFTKLVIKNIFGKVVEDITLHLKIQIFYTTMLKAMGEIMDNIEKEIDF